MISTRYGASVAFLLALALVPTVTHSYLGAVVDDGRRASAIGTVLANLPSVATARKPSWIRERFDSVDWVERSYGTPGDDDLVLSVVRSYDPKRLYHHPELAVAYRTTLQDEGIRSITTLPDVPVHVLRSPDGRTLVVYALHYDERFVDDPYVFQLRLSASLLWTGRKPMTLFFVRDREAGNQPLENSRAVQLLGGAIQSFLTQSSSGAVQDPGGASGQ